jgi:hypothetical protein
MYALCIAAVLFAPFAAAQDATLGLQAIKAHFTQSGLVPDLFSSFEPTALLKLDFSGVGTLQPGQALTKEQTGPVPTVSVQPANPSTTLSGNYTLAMIDAGVVGAKLPEGQTRHWLVNGVKVSNSIVSNTSAVGVTSYAGPWPPAGSGPHRYVVVLYEQPASFVPPADLSSPGVAVGTFVWSDYVQNSHLGPLVAATYLTVQEGTPTVSLSPTSAVVTKTLPAAAASGSASGSASKTASGSASSSTKTSDAVIVSVHYKMLTLIAAVVAPVLFLTV